METKKIAVVTDSASDIPTADIVRLGIRVVPVFLIDGKNSYRDGELAPDEVYRLLAEGRNLTTSAPSPSDFQFIFESIFSKGEINELIVVTITSKQSASYDAAILGSKGALEKYPNCKIEVIDSRAVAMAEGLLAIFAAEKAMSGVALDQVVVQTKAATTKIHAIAVLETAQYALRGGRIGGAAEKILGNMPFKVRPILTIKDGKIGPAGLVRSKHKKMETLLSFPVKFSNITDIAIEYAGEKDKGMAEEMVKEFKKDFPQSHFYVSQISSVLGVHAGPGTILVVAMEG